MKLYDLHRSPTGTLVRLVDDPSQRFLFFHIDGMYSYCKRLDGEVIHPACFTEVEIVE